MLRDAGAPTEPEQIGISRERLRQSYVQAFYLRRRFTILDLAMRTNLLEPALRAIF
jgi:glycerol-1-phosphate dehydrogenase [NAD(P)+]